MQAARQNGARSAYALLGVTPRSNAEEVRAAYKKRALETHPDKGGDPEEFRRVKQAYEFLNRPTPNAAGLVSGDPPTFDADEADTSVPLAERLKRHRRAKTMEEEINLGFASIPGKGERFVTERMSSSASARPSSLAARVSAQAAATKTASKGPGAVSVVKLWEKFTKMSDKDRQVAIAKLDTALREELLAYLKNRSNSRTGSAGGQASGKAASATTPPATRAPRSSPSAPAMPARVPVNPVKADAGDSDSSSDNDSSSSDSSDSSDDQAVFKPSVAPSNGQGVGKQGRPGMRQGNGLGEAV